MDGLYSGYAEDREMKNGYYNIFGELVQMPIYSNENRHYEQMIFYRPFSGESITGAELKLMIEDALERHGINQGQADEMLAYLVGRAR